MEETGVRFVIKEPGKAYISNNLWLPKDKLARLSSVQAALSVDEVRGNKVVTYKLWSETPNHLVVPREFIKPDQYPVYEFPFVDVSPLKYPRTHIGDTIECRDEAQLKAWLALDAATGGILNLACGKGKTVLAYKKISKLNVPALIIVNDGVQASHWKLEAEQHLILPPGETIGTYQGKDLDWQHPITIATIQTLAQHVREGKIPPGFREWFGVAVFDEVHHLAAPFFLLSADLVSGQRFGLTATAERLDKLEWIYKHHLGEVFYSDLTQDLEPVVFIQETDVVFDPNVDDIRDKRGELNLSKMRGALGENERSLAIREYCIREALNHGRKILCVSHSKALLYNLHERFPRSVICVSETPQDERIPQVQASQLAFAISKLGTECLNDSALDALFILTPFSSPNDLQQLLGRIQRHHPNKPDPVAVIFDDKWVPKLHNLVSSLRRTLLSKWGIKAKVCSLPPI
jgi:superfamily II DNA or RNA helicase